MAIVRSQLVSARPVVLTIRCLHRLGTAPKASATSVDHRSLFCRRLDHDHGRGDALATMVGHGSVNGFENDALVKVGHSGMSVPTNFASFIQMLEEAAQSVDPAVSVPYFGKKTVGIYTRTNFNAVL